MDFRKAQATIGDAVENPQSAVSTQELVLAVATVMVRTGMLNGVQFENLRIVDRTQGREAWRGKL